MILNKTYLMMMPIILLLIPSSVLAKRSFFEDRERGWLWFEEREKRPKKSKELSAHQMHQIKRKNEEFKEELELLKHAMIRYPENLSYIKRYKEKEKIMLQKSMILSRNFLMVNFLNPDIADQLSAPQNIYGRKVLKENEQLEKKKNLTFIAKEVELFLIIQGECNHCKYLEKHLSRFANLYGFKVEAISKDGSKSKYFKSNNNKELIELLSLEVVPTVIAVTNDSKYRFELARGAVSVSDLEDNALLMVKYLAAKKTDE